MNYFFFRQLKYDIGKNGFAKGSPIEQGSGPKALACSIVVEPKKSLINQLVLIDN